MNFLANPILFSHKKEWSTNICLNMNLKNILLHERSQSQKNTYYMIPFIWNVQNRQIYRQKVNQWLRRAGGDGVWRVITKGYRVPLWGDENVLKLTVVVAAHICEHTTKHLIVYIDGWIVWYINCISIKLL